MYEPQDEQLWAVHEEGADYSGGYVKLYRSMLEHRYMSNPELFTFYIWCIMKATFRPYKQLVGLQTIKLERGQFVFGREAAAMETGLTPQKIRTLIKFLKNDGKLTSKSTNKFSVITVINFDRWQNGDGPSNQQSNQQLTSNQPATNHKQEVKEVKTIICGSENEQEHSSQNKRKIKMPPSVEEVSEYCLARANGIDPDHFVNYYAARGWRLSNGPMKDWKAAVHTWEGNKRKREQESAKQESGTPSWW